MKSFRKKGTVLFRYVVLYWAFSLLFSGPGFASDLINKGVLALSEEQYQTALHYLNRALSQDPGNKAAHSYRGIAWYYLGKYENAVADYTRAADFEPDSYIVYFNRALSFLKLKKYERAVSDFILVSDMQPLDPATRFQLAWILSTCPAKMVRNGEIALEMALPLYEQHPDSDTCDLLAAAYAEKGLFKDAVAFQTKAVENLKQTRDAQPEQIEYLQQRLKLYRANKPFRE